MKKRITLYNILTTVFAILTLVSLSGITYGVSLINVFINTIVFSFLTRKCYKIETKLRRIQKNKAIRARKRKHIYLKNYTAKRKDTAKRAIS